MAAVRGGSLWAAGASRVAAVITLRASDLILLLAAVAVATVWLSTGPW
jgi:hypothetical protein